MYLQTVYFDRCHLYSSIHASVSNSFEYSRRPGVHNHLLEYLTAASSAALNANQLPCRTRALKKERRRRERERKKKARLIQHNVYTLSLNAFLSTQRIFGAH